jgi:SM-20-related protein
MPMTVDGVSVRDAFLTPSEVRALADCAELRRARGDFSAARIGGEANLQRRAEIRGDSICWITAPLLPAERALLGEFERLRLQLNAEAYLGLFDLELQHAWYPPGAGYARHVDQPHGRAQRQVSLALYLNQDWTPAAGGELRIFDAAGGHRDIEPVGGRLVCFPTPGREHEVRPARRERLSISGWFRSRD